MIVFFSLFSVSIVVCVWNRGRYPSTRCHCLTWNRGGRGHHSVPSSVLLLTQSMTPGGRQIALYLVQMNTTEFLYFFCFSVFSVRKTKRNFWCTLIFLCYINIYTSIYIYFLQINHRKKNRKIITCIKILEYRQFL